MMRKPIAIHWFRQDLRLHDNPALTQATKHENMLAIYILDEENAGTDQMGGASKLWLFHSLSALYKSLDGKLALHQGNPADIFNQLAQHYDIEAVYWNRCYEPWRIKRDTKLKPSLSSKGIKVESFNGSLLWEPWEIKKQDGTPYRIFTPFYRKGCLTAPPPRRPYPVPHRLNLIKDATNTVTPDQLNLRRRKAWEEATVDAWTIGEKGASNCLASFIQHGLSDYKQGRNFPARQHVSRLSPYLHFGEISPNQIWQACETLEMDENIDHFLSELGWREFSYNLLYFNPDLAHKNLQARFDGFPWTHDPGLLKKWQQGKTGIPMVDAGMRELWQTGYMHNRTRMIVGSFLVKNLRINWKYGARWFWDSLFDADLANNSASWQWVAGCGADAAPYFRIFNPVTQGQKFDPEGRYIRRFIPELAPLPDQYLFAPWTTPKAVLSAADITLGVTYPHPVVELKQSRLEALEAFKSL